MLYSNLMANCDQFLDLKSYNWIALKLKWFQTNVTIN